MKPQLYMIKGVGIGRTSNAPFGDTAGVRQYWGLF